MSDHDRDPGRRETDHESLVQDATNGDGVAVEALLARHYPSLLAWVRLRADPLIRAHESCNDIVQSVCREALDDLDGFEYRGEAAFRAWLVKVALNKLTSRKRYLLALRRDVRRVQHDGDSRTSAGVEALYAKLASPSQIASDRETVERFERVFRQMPEDYQAVIARHKILGMTHREIADEMGRTEGAVTALLARARARLALLLRRQRSMET